MTMTDLDHLAIGSTCASKSNTTIPVERWTFGMVIEFGVHEDTQEPYVIVLSEVPPREVNLQVKYQSAKNYKHVGVARLRQIDLADIDPDSVEPPHASRMEGWAKKALAGEVVLPGETFSLAAVAAMLFQEARKYYVTPHRDADKLEGELRKRMAES